MAHFMSYLPIRRRNSRLSESKKKAGKMSALNQKLESNEADQQEHQEFPFLDLPKELRDNVYYYALLSVPGSFNYSEPTPPIQQKPTKSVTFCRHGLLLANKQISYEYAQAFYNRTSFFFHISSANYRWIRERKSPLPGEEWFWKLSPDLISNVRSCKVYIEFNDIARQEGQKAVESKYHFYSARRSQKSFLHPWVCDNSPSAYAICSFHSLLRSCVHTCRSLIACHGSTQLYPLDHGSWTIYTLHANC
jgi:hypothetical protein